MYVILLYAAITTANSRSNGTFSQQTPLINLLPSVGFIYKTYESCVRFVFLLPPLVSGVYTLCVCVVFYCRIKPI